MTGRQHGGAPMGPPWPVEVLADLHAGALDEAVARELWPQVRADAQASEVLAALEATVADLGAFGDLAGVEPIPMPTEFAARLDAALAAELAARPAAPVAPAPPLTAPVSPPGQMVDLAAARRRRNRRFGIGGGIITVAAAVAAVLLVALPKTTGGTGTAVAGGPPSAGATANGGSDTGSAGTPLALGNSLGPRALNAALGHTDYGALTDPGALSACLSANHADPNRTPAGAAQVTIDGKAGTLLVLPTGQTAQWRLLVVGPDCAAGDPDTIADATVGGLSDLPTPAPTK